MKKTCRLSILLVVLIVSSLTLLGTINLSAAASMHLSIKNSKASVIAGGSITCTVTALDSLNNVVKTYAGNIEFSCSDPNAVLPTNAALKSGTGSFSITFETAGPQTITVTDKVDSTLTTTASVTVTSAKAKSFNIIAPSTVSPGASFTITVTAKDIYGNLASGYSGTVDFASTDNQAILPATGALTQGRGMFSLTLNEPGSQTVTITDISDRTITSSNEVNVAAGAPLQPTLTPTSAPTVSAVASPTEIPSPTPNVETSPTVTPILAPTQSNAPAPLALPMEAVVGIVVVVIAAVIIVGFLVFRKK